MIKQAIIALLLCATSFGITPAQRQWMLGGPVYPPQGRLVQWLTGNDGTNATARVGSDAQVVQRNALSFAGGAEGALIPFNQSIGGSDFLISFNIKLDANTGTDYVLTDYITSTSDRAFHVSIASGLVAFTFSDDGTTLNAITAATSINDGEWHDIKIYRSRDFNYCYLFIDGTLDKRLAPTLGDIHASGNDISLGSLWTGSAYAAAIEGSLADVKIELNDTPIDVFLMIGQSNMHGAPADYGTLPTLLQGFGVPQYGYAINQSTYSLDTLVHPVSSTVWGLELTFAEKYFAMTGRKCLIAKIAKGGTNMHTDWQKGGSMYQETLTYYPQIVAAAEARGYTMGDVKLVVAQGENDSTSATESGNWAANFRQMRSDLQADLGVTFSQTIIARVSSSVLTAGYTYVPVVQAQQESINDAVIINTDSFEVKADNIHFSSEGLQALGLAVADAVTLNANNNSLLFNLPLEEGAGSTVYDVSGNGNHGTITGGTWTKVDGVQSYNALYGFRDSSGILIPALLDGSAAADGNPITNLGGVVHNGGGYSLLLNGVTNSYADLQLWNGADGGPIKNAFIYDAEPANTNALNIYCNLFDGVWTNR